jgi:hypothetical protein
LDFIVVFIRYSPLLNPEFPFFLSWSRMRLCPPVDPSGATTVFIFIVQFARRGPLGCAPGVTPSGRDRKNTGGGPISPEDVFLFPKTMRDPSRSNSESLRKHRGYHLTELKAASFETVDCGGQTNRWQETIVQL